MGTSAVRSFWRKRRHEQDIGKNPVSCKCGNDLFHDLITIGKTLVDIQLFRIKDLSSFGISPSLFPVKGKNIVEIFGFNEIIINTYLPDHLNNTIFVSSIVKQGEQLCQN